MSLFLLDICNKDSSSQLNEKDLTRVRLWLSEQAKNMWENPDNVASVNYFEQMAIDSALPEDIRLNARIIKQLYQFRINQLSELEHYYNTKKNWSSDKERLIVKQIITELKRAGTTLLGGDELIDKNKLAEFVKETNRIVRSDSKLLRLLNTPQDNIFVRIIKGMRKFITGLTGHGLYDSRENSTKMISKISDNMI